MLLLGHWEHWEGADAPSDAPLSGRRCGWSQCGRGGCGTCWWCGRRRREPRRRRRCWEWISPTRGPPAAPWAWCCPSGATPRCSSTATGVSASHRGDRRASSSPSLCRPCGERGPGVATGSLGTTLGTGVWGPPWARGWGVWVVWWAQGGRAPPRGLGTWLVLGHRGSQLHSRRRGCGTAAVSSWEWGRGHHTGHRDVGTACEDAARGGHIPGGPALAWARGYAAALGSEQSCLNEWLAMADLESVRPASPTALRPAVPELSEQAVRALLREVMAAADLENVTSKEVREELERRTGHSLAEHKDFIDNEMLLVLAQMDRPSRVFPHLFLGSEWNAANLEELQQNKVTHILNVAREIDNFFPALFTYMNVRVYDEEAAELLPHWNDTFLFLSRVRAAGGRALVHCRMGLSRSAATVLAYAMKEFGWPLERALRHVRHCRPGVLPNPGFMRQLDFYQGILRASPHSSLWEPRPAEQAPRPEEDTVRDTSGLSPLASPLASSLSSPLASPQPSEEEAAAGGLLGASRRPRISLCSVMRSISLLETPEPPELLGEPLAAEVFEAAEEAEGPSPRSRPSSRPRGVVRQASLDGGPAPLRDHTHGDGHTQAPGHAHSDQPAP
uniref:protein-serine/threonine phosphatase n=1 Tax=Ficedula albicollis TaxID=59894 RepID=U3KCR7_FICAL